MFLLQYCQVEMLLSRTFIRCMVDVLVNTVGILFLLTLKNDILNVFYTKSG